MIRLYTTETDYREVSETDIVEISQEQGDIDYYYDWCGSRTTRFLCKECLEKENKGGCNSRKKAYVRTSPPGPIEVLFKNGKLEFFQRYKVC